LPQRRTEKTGHTSLNNFRLVSDTALIIVQLHLDRLGGYELKF